MDKLKPFLPIIIFILITILSATGFLYSVGYRLTPGAALKADSFLDDMMPAVEGKKIDIKASAQADNSYFLIYEIKNSDIFGAARFKKLGFLWRTSGATFYDDEREQHKPFKFLGYGSSEHFFIGLKIYDPNIKYVAVGADEKILAARNESGYISKIESRVLHYDDVKNNPDTYQVAEVTGNYAAFVIEDYDDAIIRALDENGKVIADYFHGYGERYINPEEKQGLTLHQSVSGYIDRDGRYTLVIRMLYQNHDAHVGELEEKYYFTDMDLINLTVNHVSEGISVNKLNGGIEISGIVEDRATVRYVVEGLTRFSGSGWNRVSGERIRVNIPVYNAEHAKVPVEHLHIRLSLSQVAKNITNPNVTIYSTERGRQVKNMFGSLRSGPHLTFESSSLDGLESARLNLEFSIDDMLYQEKATRNQNILFILVMGLIMFNIALYKMVQSRNGKL